MKKIMLAVLGSLMLTSAIPALCADIAVLRKAAIEAERKKNQKPLKGAIKIAAGSVAGLLGIVTAGLAIMCTVKPILIKTGLMLPEQEAVMFKQDDGNIIASLRTITTGKYLGCALFNTIEAFACIPGAVVLIKSGIKDCRGK